MFQELCGTLWTKQLRNCSSPLWGSRRAEKELWGKYWRSGEWCFFCPGWEDREENLEVICVQTFCLWADLVLEMPFTETKNKEEELGPSIENSAFHWWQEIKILGADHLLMRWLSGKPGSESGTRHGTWQGSPGEEGGARDQQRTFLKTVVS